MRFFYFVSLDFNKILLALDVRIRRSGGAIGDGGRDDDNVTMLAACRVRCACGSFRSMHVASARCKLQLDSMALSNMWRKMHEQQLQFRFCAQCSAVVL